MKEETKKNIQDGLGDFFIAATCFLVVTSLNNKCTGIAHREEAKQHSEKPQQTQPVKQKMVYVAKQKTR